MRKINLLTLSLLMGMSIQAQSIKEVKKMYANKEFWPAKETIQKMLQNPKFAQDAEVWYYKGLVWNACSKESNNQVESSYLFKDQAFESFKTCQLYDKKDALMILEMYGSYFDLYAGLYNLGLAAYQDKNYSTALNSFVKTTEVIDYIFQHEYTYSGYELKRFDTSLYTNILITALLADSLSVGSNYFAKLADIQVKNNDMHDLAENLLSSALKTGDEASFLLTLNKAKSLFPGEAIWFEYEIKLVENKKDTTALYAKYEELINSNPNQHNLCYNYAAILYNALYADDPSKAVYSREETSIKFMDIIDKSIQSEEKDGVISRILLNRFLYNNMVELTEKIQAIKGNKPENQEARKKLKQKMDELNQQMLQNSLAAAAVMESIPTKTPIQKGNYKVILQTLIQIYGDNKNQAKVAEYKQISAELDR